MERLLGLLLLTCVALIAMGGSYLLGDCTQGCTNTFCNIFASSGQSVCNMYSVTVGGVTTQKQQALDSPGIFAQTNNGKFPLKTTDTTLDVWNPTCTFTCDTKAIPQEGTGKFNKVNQQKGQTQMKCTPLSS